jgi:hypothetical protein
MNLADVGRQDLRLETQSHWRPASESEARGVGREARATRLFERNYLLKTHRTLLRHRNSDAPTADNEKKKWVFHDS